MSAADASLARRGQIGVRSTAVSDNFHSGATLTLLVRAYCHLCDEMLAELRPLADAGQARIAVVDVDAPGNEALEASFGERVPALFVGTPEERTLLCTIRLGPAAVRAALARAR